MTAPPESHLATAEGDVCTVGAYVAFRDGPERLGEHIVGLAAYDAAVEESGEDIAEVTIAEGQNAGLTGWAGRYFLNELQRYNDDANPGLFRVAHKMATGTGKTATAFHEIVEFQGITFEQAKVEVRLGDDGKRTFNIEKPEAGHPFTEDLENLTIENGEPTPASLFDGLRAALGSVAI